MTGRDLASGMVVQYVEAEIIGRMSAQIRILTRTGSTAGVGDGGQGQGRGRGATVADGVVQSNQLRRSECNRCKFAAKNIPSCLGCKKSSNIDHCLLHCGQYICLGVEDRVKLIRGGNACAVCLSAGHQAGSCNYKDKNNWVCGIDGCTSHHHPTLHGSKDMFVKINTLGVVGENRFEDITEGGLPA